MPQRPHCSANEHSGHLILTIQSGAGRVQSVARRWGSALARPDAVLLSTGRADGYEVARVSSGVTHPNPRAEYWRCRCGVSSMVATRPRPLALSVVDSQGYWDFTQLKTLGECRQQPQDG